MSTHFSGADISTNELRAELIYLADSGDKQAPDLLRTLVQRTEGTLGELVVSFARAAGSPTLEVTLAGLGWVCFSLIAGVMLLAYNQLVATDLETFLILLFSFVLGQSCLHHYTKMTTARYYAQEFQKLAGVLKINSLVKQHYSPLNAVGSPRKMQYAYGSVA